MDAQTAGKQLAKKFSFVNKQSLKEFKALPRKIQERFAADLNEICKGKEPYSPFKHIASSVGIGAIELIENGRPAYRTIYVAKFKQTVFVRHSFTKTTDGTGRKAMTTAKQRYKLIAAELKNNISVLVCF